LQEQRSLKAVSELRVRFCPEVGNGRLHPRKKTKELKKSDKNAPIVLIKADENAKYKNLVDIIDEMLSRSIAICNR
jgi:PII-like signaling protein